jgi:tripartite-type tricarboxylate transporter receptor subunit TctC
MILARLFAAAAFAVLALSTSHAQDFPSKRLTIVVPFPAGSPADVRARIIATHLAVRVKQPVIVDNRPGASGNIAAQLVAKSKPDGHTILYANNGQIVINPHLYSNPGFDGVKDFAPVTQLVSIPWVLIANVDVPAKSVAELIALAKAQPGKLSYASSGIGTPQHVLGEQFEKMAGVDMLHVPYKGENLSVNDLLNGQISVLFATPVSTLPLIKANKVKLLGVSAVKRIRSLPQAPMVAETLPGFDAMGWAVIAVPAATPASVVALLNKHITEIMLAPEIKDKEEAAGYEVLANSPQQAAAAIKQESARYAKLIAELKLRVE